MVWLRRYRRSGCAEATHPRSGLPAGEDGSGGPSLPQDLPLSEVPEGETVRVNRICAEAEHARRLREIGLIEGRTVELLLPGDPLICRVGRSRFGLCRRLADCVRVRRVP